jgi:hypothetical protein
MFSMQHTGNRQEAGEHFMEFLDGTTLHLEKMCTGTCFSRRTSLVIDPAGPRLQKGGWLKNLRDIGDQSRELPRRMLQLRPRASFRSSQLRLRNLFPYYSHRGSFHEETTTAEAAPGGLGTGKSLSIATFLEDPHLFLEKNSTREAVDSSKSNSCEDLRRMDPDSPVSLSDTFSSEIFLELARCRVPVCDLNSNVRCAEPHEGECGCDDEASSLNSSRCERTLCQKAAENHRADMSEDCASSGSSSGSCYVVEELLPSCERSGGSSSWWGQPAAER